MLVQKSKINKGIVHIISDNAFIYFAEFLNKSLYNVT